MASLNPQQFDEFAESTGMSSMGDRGVRVGDQLLPVGRRWQTRPSNGNVITGITVPMENGASAGLYHRQEPEGKSNRKPYLAFANINGIEGDHPDSHMDFETADEAARHLMDLSKRTNYGQVLKPDDPYHDPRNGMFD